MKNGTEGMKVAIYDDSETMYMATIGEDEKKMIAGTFNHQPENFPWNPEKTPVACCGSVDPTRFQRTVVCIGGGNTVTVYLYTRFQIEEEKNPL